jgi:hypothetical protein
VAEPLPLLLPLRSATPEVPGIDPFVFQERPPVVGESLQHVLIWEPAVTFVSPSCAPGIPDQQCPRGLLRSTSGILYLHFVVASGRNNRVASNRFLALRRIGYLSGLCCLDMGAVNREPEHGGKAAGEVRLYLLQQVFLFRRRQIEPVVADYLVVLGESVAEADGSFTESATLYRQYSSGGTPKSTSAPIVVLRKAPVCLLSSGACFSLPCRGRAVMRRYAFRMPFFRSTRSCPRLPEQCTLRACPGPRQAKTTASDRPMRAGPWPSLQPRPWRA